MAALAVASVLANPNVSSAIVGASRPEQLDDPVKAAEMVFDDEMLERIDDALGDVVERDPAKVGLSPGASKPGLQPPCQDIRRAGTPAPQMRASGSRNSGKVGS